jgi:dethiobiotin synthetase
MSCFFVTGTDTDVGKTLVTSALLHKARQQQWITAAIKPVAAGCPDETSGDALALQAEATLSFDYHAINPITLTEPISPHIAAKEQGIEITLPRLAAACEPVLTSNADLILIEGSGGWFCPINATQTLADFVAYLKTDVILVVGLRLGCLNHSLLTAAAIQQAGLCLAGWVGSTLNPNMLRLSENIETLTQRIPAPCLGIVPFLAEPTAHQAAHYLSLPG